MRDCEVEDKGARQIFSDLVFLVPEGEKRHVEADENTLLLLQPSETAACRQCSLASGFNEREKVEI